MNVYVLSFIDSDMNVSALCDDYISLSFTQEFCGEGEFECVLRAGAALPQLDSLVMCGGLLYVVERISTDTARAQVQIGGRGILSYLGRRSIYRPLPLRKSVESAVNYLVESFASDVLPAPLSVGQVGSAVNTDIVVEEGNLLARLRLLASSVMKGLRLRYSAAAQGFVFELYDTRERRIAHDSAQEPILLGEAPGTLSALHAVSDKSDYLNRVRVRDTLSGGVTNTVTVDAASYSFADGYDDSGEQQREGFVRSGIAMSLYTSEDESGEEVFDSEGYYAAMAEYGRQYLSKHRVRRELTARLTDAAAVSVGDVCSICTPAMDCDAVLIRAKQYLVKNGELSCIASMTAIG